MTRSFGPLLLYRQLADSELVRKVVELHGTPHGAGAAALYAGIFSALAAQTEPGEDPWRHYLRAAVVSEDTAFSRAARRTAGRPSEGLADAMRHDLTIIERLHRIDGDELARTATSTDGPLPSWRSLASDDATLRGIEAILAETDGWKSLVETLWDHFRSHSAEPFVRHSAFRWSGSDLIPVVDPDPVRLSDLIGYERERELLIQNTEILVAGHRGNNVLLYGPRGTGKSSTIKALVNGYKDEGLRLVQVERPDLGRFPDIMGELRGRPERFIVFLDDLAFELGENEYAHLKGLLEGGLETRPQNVVVYATSNRRHLVDERFADRDSPDDVVHVTDTYQHRLSLADRFGIRIMLPAADQARYLTIVEGLAKRRGLSLPNEALTAEALRWSTAHNGFSPRTAQQLVDHLAGSSELA
jgi:uncharacterized protein